MIDILASRFLRRGVLAILACSLLTGLPACRALADEGRFDYSPLILDVFQPVKSYLEPDRHAWLPTTMQRLNSGEPINVVMLGDSIVRDTFLSEWWELLDESYPNANLNIRNSTRSVTGVSWYREEGNVQSFVLDHDPDLVMIGGISNRNDVEAMRDVIAQIRAGSDSEILLMSDTANLRSVPDNEPGFVLPNGTASWRSVLKEIAIDEQTAYVDLRSPWNSLLVRANAVDPTLDSLYLQRDSVHMNSRGEQLVANALEAFFSPDPIPNPDFNLDGVVNGDDFLLWQAGASRYTGIRATPANANFTREGIVDGDDFLIWQSNFGPPPNQGTLADGDFSGDGYVGGEDFLLWQSGYNEFRLGGAEGADGDANGDGMVDGDDFLIWQSGADRFPPPRPTSPGGDADGDGDVDGDDFLIWQQNFGAFFLAGSHADGDADGNGIVDGDDFLLWQTYFGEPPPGGVDAGSAAIGQAIPEPGALGLCLAIAAAALARASVVR